MPESGTVPFPLAFPLQRCHWLHHFDPYLKLGPVKAEYELHEPFRMVFHDILTEEEIRSEQGN